MTLDEFEKQLDTVVGQYEQDMRAAHARFSEALEPVMLGAAETISGDTIAALTASKMKGLEKRLEDISG